MRDSREISACQRTVLKTLAGDERSDSPAPEERHLCRTRRAIDLKVGRSGIFRAYGAQ